MSGVGIGGLEERKRKKNEGQVWASASRELNRRVQLNGNSKKSFCI